MNLKHTVLIVLLFLLTVAGIFAPEAAAQDGVNNDTLTVVAPALNARSGPAISYPVLDILAQGQQVAVVNYNAASDWWQVRLPGGGTGWVSGGEAYVSVGSLADAPTQNSMPEAQTSTIVFQAAGGGGIYAVNPDNGSLRYLTTGMDPALSPDGQWVAFTRWETSQDGALGNVWLINVNGTGERVIHENVLNPRAPSWSPDGRQIAISMQHGGRVQPERTCGSERPPRNAYDIEVSGDRGNRKFCYTRPPDPHWGLRMIDVATGAHQDLPGDTYSLSPAWNPANPQHLVYDGDRGLVNLSLATGLTWPLTEDFNDHSPVFSPDGSRIAVSYRQDDHWDIHVMPAAGAGGSGRVRLTQTSYQTFAQQILNGQQPHSFNNASPAWSPDGSQIAFVTDRAGQWEIWLMSADGSQQRPLLSAETLAGISPQYNGVDEQILSWR